MSPFAHVTGWGMAVPEKILTNDDLARMVDTNDEWIVSMTGIHNRHIAEKGETTASLATRAAVEAHGHDRSRAERSTWSSSPRQRRNTSSRPRPVWSRARSAPAAPAHSICPPPVRVSSSP
jgi:hypothetical protein